MYKIAVPNDLLKCVNNYDEAIISLCSEKSRDISTHRWPYIAVDIPRAPDRLYRVGEIIRVFGPKVIFRFRSLDINYEFNGEYIDFPVAFITQNGIIIEKAGNDKSINIFMPNEYRFELAKLDAVNICNNAYIRHGTFYTGNINVTNNANSLLELVNPNEGIV